MNKEKIKEEVLEEVIAIDNRLAKEIDEKGLDLKTTEAYEEVANKTVENLVNLAIDLAIEKTAQAIFDDLEKGFGESIHCSG